MPKRILFTILLLIFPLSLISCAKSGSQNKIDGIWKDKNETVCFKSDGSFTASQYWSNGSYVIDDDYIILSFGSDGIEKYKYDVKTESKNPKKYILCLYDESGNKEHEFKRNKNFVEYSMTLWPSLRDGAVVMVKLFLLTLLLALPLGLPFALGSAGRIKPLRWLCRIYVWLFRGTPLILQLFFFYFFLPIAFINLGLDIKLEAFPTAVITFVLNYAAYFAEIYRGGIESIDRGQHEAARSLGISKTRTMFGIILPQTVKRVLPPVTNETITLVKDTALASVISVTELMKTSRGAVNRDSDPMAYAIAAAIYLAFTFLLTILSRRLERRFSRHLAKGD